MGKAHFADNECQFKEAKKTQLLKEEDARKEAARAAAVEKKRAMPPPPPPIYTLCWPEPMHIGVNAGYQPTPWRDFSAT